MKKLLALMQRAPKRTGALCAMIAAAIIVPLALNAWGPDRRVFTVQNPAPYITFNSITNNPNIGDERNFVGIRESGTSNKWSDNITVQDGKEYTVRMYVHNNAAANLNLVAQNVTAKFNLPTATAKSIQVHGYLSASNSNPGQVYDHATFNSSKNFNLAVVPNSIKYENNKGTFNLSQNIFTSTGVKLGYDKMDGKIPGCFEYAGYVTFRVKPQVQKTTNFTLEKKVSQHGKNNWVENYKAKPGEIVDFILAYKNTGEVQHNSVTFRDTLPAGLTYVAGSAKWNNTSKQNNAIAGTKLTNGTGVNVGSYAPGANAWVTFSAKVADNSKLPVCGTNALRNVGKVNTGGYAVEDDATVTVDRTCAEPSYGCDSLTVTKLERTKFKFSARSITVGDAQLKGVTYVVKNAVGKQVYRGTNSTYTQTVAGKYTVQAILVFVVKGQTKTVTSDRCKGTFTVAPAPVVPKYTCDNLSVKKLERTKFQFTTKYTAQHATYKSTTYVVKNAAGKQVYRGTNSTYTQTTPGTYSVQAIVTFTVNGTSKTVTSAGCKATFKVEKEKIPGVSITKKVNGVKSTKVAVGEEFAYQLVIKNTGEVNLTNVKVADSAPANVKFVRASVGTIANNKWSYTIPSLKVGQSISISIKAKVTKYVAGTIKNTACVDAPQVPGSPDDCDDATVEVKKPGVSIDKKVDGVEHKKVSVNETFTYQLVVKNTGQVDLKNAKVTDNAPANVQFISANKGTIANNKWSYTIPSLAVGKSVSVTIKATVTKYVSGKIKNTACVDAPQVPGNPDDCDDATVEVKKPGVSIDKKVDGVEHKKVSVNQEFVYQLVIKNTGQSTLTNVQVADNAPANVQFIRADKGTIANNKWSYTIPSLAVGKSTTVAITAKVTKEVEGIIKNTACVDAPQVPGSPDDCDDATVEVPPTPVVPEVEVCDLTTKKVITIKENEFDSAKHSKNLDDCKETPVTPPELPTTGISESVMAVIGLGSLVASISYYAISRRSLGA